MSKPEGTQKRLVVGLSAGLGAALLVIAFMVGRMTVTPVPVSPSGTEASAVKPPDGPANASSTASIQGSSPAPSGNQTSMTGAQPQPQIYPSGAPPLSETRPSSSSPEISQQTYPSRPLAGGRTAGDPAAAKEAITSYFAKMDSIQVAGSGDTTTFAQGILQGIKDGDLSRVDDLVTNARSALAQAKSVQPPSVCAEYHNRLLAVLSDSVAGLEQFRTALQNNDTKAMLSLAARFQSKQQEFDRLELLKKQLLAS